MAYVLVAGGVSLLSGKRSEWLEVGMHRHMYVYEHTPISTFLSVCIETHEFTLSQILVPVTTTPKLTEIRHNHFIMLMDSCQVFGSAQWA